MSDAVTSRISVHGTLVLTSVQLLGSTTGTGFFAIQLLGAVNGVAAKLGKNARPAWRAGVGTFILQARPA